MNLPFKWIGMLLLLYLGTQAAHGQDLPRDPDQAFLQLKRQIEAHYFSYDEAVILDLLDQSQILIQRHPQAWQPYYYAGMIQLQLGNIVRALDRDRACQYYLKALEHIQRVHAISPSPESTIVLSSAYGKLASLKTLKMFYYGSKTKSYMIEAFELNKNSPKVFLMAGIHIMWTPAIFGGSKKRSREFLEKALQLDQNWTESNRFVVRWATPPEIFAHLAQLEILCDAPDKAKHYVAKALDHIPNYGFVTRDVLPQLN